MQQLFPPQSLEIERKIFVLIVLTGELSQAGVGETTASQVHLDGLVTVFEQADPGDRQRYQMYWQISQHLMLM
jgi:hypothetical protein